MKNTFYFFQAKEGSRSPQWKLMGTFGPHIPTTTLLNLLKKQADPISSQSPVIDIDYEELDDDDDADWHEIMDCDSM